MASYTDVVELDQGKFTEYSEIENVPIGLIRRGYYSHPGLQVFLVLLFLFLSDTVGFFSAVPTVSEIVVFDQDWQNLVLIFVPLAFFHYSAVAILMAGHDWPLCKYRPINQAWVWVGIICQSFHSLLWIIVLVLFIKDALTTNCSANCGTIGNSTSNCTLEYEAICKAASPTYMGAFFIVGVALNSVKNTFTALKRKNIYPIFFSEQILFTTLSIEGHLNLILDYFVGFHKLNEVKKTCGKVSETGELNQVPGGRLKIVIVFRFIFVVIKTVIGMSLLAVVLRSPNFLAGVINSLYFLPVLIVEVISAALLLTYHDIPLIHGKPIVDILTIRIAKFLQIVVALGWIVLFVFGAYVLFNPNCVAICSCAVPSFPLTNCDQSSVCTSPLTCNSYPSNITVCSTAPTASVCTVLDSSNTTYTVSYKNNQTILCDNTNVITIAQCFSNGPTITTILVLLTLALYHTRTAVEVFMRSYIYPLFVTEQAYFAQLWKDRTPASIKTFLEATGRLALGRNYTVTISSSDLEKYALKNANSQ